MLPLAITDEIVEGLPYNGKDEIGQFVKSAFNLVRGQVLKLELRQEYRQPGKPYDQAILAGRLGEARRYIPAIIENNRSTYMMFEEKHVELVRCRSIKFPMTPYTKWEVELYQESAKAFERIYWCLYEELDVVFQTHARHDFMVFDAKVAIVEDYDEDGYFKGGWFVDSPNDVLSLISMFAFIKANSMSIDVLQSPDVGSEV